MKKLFFTLLCAALAVSTVMAQETQKKPSFAGFKTNGFWSNWEISAGLGAGTAFSSGDNMGKRVDRIGFEGSFSVTKWLHPVVGLRGQLQGGWYNNFDSKGEHEWPYLFAHGDLMINLSNWIGGYREDRVYYAVPFVGMGLMRSNFTDGSQKRNGGQPIDKLAATVGLLNKFRVCKSLDIDLEFKSLFTKSGIAPYDAKGRAMIGLSTTVGVTYRFNKRGWTRALDEEATAIQIAAYQKAAADSKANWEAAQAENAKMAQDLDAARKDAADAKAALAALAAEEDTTVFPDNETVVFSLASSKITSKEATRLDLVADMIKKGPSDRVYTISGHADAQTGTPEINQRIAEQRAKNVYNYLIKKGVNADQLKYQSCGDKKNPYEIQKANRAAVIE